MKLNITLVAIPVNHGKELNPPASQPDAGQEAPCPMIDHTATEFAELKAKFGELDKEMFQRLEEQNFMGRMSKGQFNETNTDELAKCIGILEECSLRLDSIDAGLDKLDEKPGLENLEGGRDLDEHVTAFGDILRRMLGDAKLRMKAIVYPDAKADYPDCDGCCGSCNHSDECTDDDEDCDGDCDSCAYADICDDADVSNAEDDDEEGNTIKDDAEGIVVEFNKVINKVTASLIRHDFRERLLNGKFTEDNYDEVVGLFTLQQRMVCLGEKAMSDLDDLLDECYFGDEDAEDYINENMGLIQENVDVAVKTMECLRLWMERVNGGIRVGDEEPSDSVLEKVSKLKCANPNVVCKSFKERLDSLTGPVSIEHSMVPSLDIVRKCEPITGSHNAMVEDNMSRATSFLEGLKVMLQEAVVYQGTLTEDSALYAMMDVIVDKMISMAEQLEEDIYTMTLWLALADVQN